MKEGFGVLDTFVRIFKKYIIKQKKNNKLLFRVYIASSKHSQGLREFSKVMQTLDFVARFHNCLR